MTEKDKTGWGGQFFPWDLKDHCKGFGFYFKWMASHWLWSGELQGSDLRVSKLTLTALLSTAAGGQGQKQED